MRGLDVPRGKPVRLPAMVSSPPNCQWAYGKLSPTASGSIKQRCGISPGGGRPIPRGFVTERGKAQPTAHAVGVLLGDMIHQDRITDPRRWLKMPEIGKWLVGVDELVDTDGIPPRLRSERFWPDRLPSADRVWPAGYRRVLDPQDSGVHGKGVGNSQRAGFRVPLEPPFEVQPVLAPVDVTVVHVFVAPHRTAYQLVEIRKAVGVNPPAAGYRPGHGHDNHLLELAVAQFPGSGNLAHPDEGEREHGQHIAQMVVEPCLRTHQREHRHRRRHQHDFVAPGAGERHSAKARQHCCDGQSPCP